MMTGSPDFLLHPDSSSMAKQDQLGSWVGSQSPPVSGAWDLVGWVGPAGLCRDLVLVLVVG